MVCLKGEKKFNIITLKKRLVSTERFLTYHEIITQSLVNSPIYQRKVV